MNRTEIIDQLRYLREFCQAQLQPDANRMWARDVEALTAVIEQLEQDQWIPVEQEMPKEHDSMFKKLRGTAAWRDGMFETISKDVLVTLEYTRNRKSVTTIRTVNGKWKLPELGNPKVIAWKPMPKPAEVKRK